MRIKQIAKLTPTRPDLHSDTLMNVQGLPSLKKISILDDNEDSKMISNSSSSNMVKIKVKAYLVQKQDRPQQEKRAVKAAQSIL